MGRTVVHVYTRAKSIIVDESKYDDDDDRMFANDGINLQSHLLYLN